MASAACDLHIIKIGQPSRACWALAQTCGLIKENKVALKIVDFARGEHREPPFLKINPNGSIPALYDRERDFGIGESVAIMKYLVCRFDLPEHWYPSELSLRTRVDEYCDWHHTHCRDVAVYFFHRHWNRKNPKLVVPARLEMGRRAAEHSIVYVNDNYFRDSAFMIGSDISIADLTCYMELGGLQWDEDFAAKVKALPKLWRWIETMSAQSWHDEVMALAHDRMDVRKSRL